MDISTAPGILIPTPVSRREETRDGDFIAHDTEMVQLWLDGLRSEHTRRAYRLAHDQFMHWADWPALAHIQERQLLDWRSHLLAQGRTPGTVNLKLAALRSLLGRAVRKGYLAYHPAGELVSLPNPAAWGLSAPRHLSRAQVQAIRQHVGNARDQTLVLALYHTGCRVSELLTAVWGDILKEPVPTLIVTGKGTRRRSLRLTPTLMADLQVLRDATRAAGLPARDSDPLFVTRTGRPIGARQVNHLLTAAARRAGVPFRVSAHGLRHAHASHALDAGAPVHVVRETLGHASLATTTRYVHARQSGDSGRWLE